MVVSGASGSWGCGAAHENLWFQLQWPEPWAEVSIAPKELVPIVVAATLWGPYWAGQHVWFLCDSMAVVAVVNKGAARDPTLSHLLRILAFVAAVLDLHVSARHLPGLQNSSADALSRDRLPLFFSQPTGIASTKYHPQRAPDTGVQPHPAVDIASLDSAVEHFLDNCVAPSTRTAYRSGQHRYANDTL